MPDAPTTNQQDAPHDCLAAHAEADAAAAALAAAEARTEAAEAALEQCQVEAEARLTAMRAKLAGRRGAASVSVKLGWSRKAKLGLWGSISLGGLGSLLFAAYYGHAVLAQWGWMVYAPAPVVVPAANHCRELLEQWRAERRLTGTQRADADRAIREDGGK